MGISFISWDKSETIFWTKKYWMAENNRRKCMFENPDDLNEHNIITFEQQVMYAIQIASGLVSYEIQFIFNHHF